MISLVYSMMSDTFRGIMMVQAPAIHPLQVKCCFIQLCLYLQALKLGIKNS
jgi:hypothetical protein